MLVANYVRCIYRFQRFHHFDLRLTSDRESIVLLSSFYFSWYISIFHRPNYVRRTDKAGDNVERKRKKIKEKEGERASRRFCASLSAQGLEESFSSWSHGSSRRLVLGIWNWYKSIFYTFFFYNIFQIIKYFSIFKLQYFIFLSVPVSALIVRWWLMI